MPDPAFALPDGFLGERGTRDLRIDGVLRSLVAASKAHGTRPDSGLRRMSMLGINLVLRGRGRYVEASGREHGLVPGVLFHRYPGVEHTTVFDAASDYAELFVVLDGDTGAALLRGGLVSSTPVMPVGVDPIILDEFRHLMKRIRTPESELPSRRALLDAVGFVGDLYDRARRQRSLDRWDALIADACQLLDHQLDERTPIAAVARRLGVSYAAFRKRFTAATGYAPADYRIRRRLEWAQHALMGASVTDAARQLGYSDPYAFSNQFKAFVGMSPRAFQRRMRHRLVLVPLARTWQPGDPPARRGRRPRA